MGDIVVDLAGTEAGSVLALTLALLSALAHAIFGAINKGGRDPYLNRGAINFCYGIIAAPVALFMVPWPTPELFQVLCFVFLIHLGYQWFQARAYEMGGFTVVYPIARGTGPLATVFIAGVVFGESFSGIQWIGLALLTGAIYGLALANMRTLEREDPASLKQLKAAIIAALITGITVSGYTTIDAYGIRLAENPFSFLAWFFFIDGFGFPVIAYMRWRRLPEVARPDTGRLMIRGFFGAIIAFLSFGAVMLATRLDKVGEAAAIRETSIVFATAIGVLIFREKIDLTRLALIMAIAIGAIVIEMG